MEKTFAPDRRTPMILITTLAACGPAAAPASPLAAPASPPSITPRPRADVVRKIAPEWIVEAEPYAPIPRDYAEEIDALGGLRVELECQTGPSSWDETGACGAVARLDGREVVVFGSSFNEPEWSSSHEPEPAERDFPWMAAATCLFEHVSPESRADDSFWRSLWLFAPEEEPPAGAIQPTPTFHVVEDGVEDFHTAYWPDLNRCLFPLVEPIGRALVESHPHEDGVWIELTFERFGRDEGELDGVLGGSSPPPPPPPPRGR